MIRMYSLAGISWLLFLLTSTDGFQSNNHRNVSELLDNLLRGYDNSIRPDFGAYVRSYPAKESNYKQIIFRWARSRKYLPEIKAVVLDGGHQPSWKLTSWYEVWAPFRKVHYLICSYNVGGSPTLRHGLPASAVIKSKANRKLVNITYSMDCYFRQTWIDARLSYSSSNKGTLALSISMLSRIWKPDTVFWNGKQSYLHTITTPNKFVRLYQDGRVLYSSRLTVKASCPMNLEDFPMDTQRCPLKLGSFGYTTRDVIYRWNSNRTVAIAPDMKMSQFDLTDTPSGNSTDRMKSGEYSSLVVSFHLHRHMGNYLITVYGPCTLLVVLSWLSFWLNREATADRVSLGVTTVLTICFLGLETRSDLPKVPYPTALDFFVFLSFVFIFATIIQFAVVHYFTKYGSGEKYFCEETTSEDDSDTDERHCNRAHIHGGRCNQMSIIGVPPPKLNNGGMGTGIGTGMGLGSGMGMSTAIGIGAGIGLDTGMEMDTGGLSAGGPDAEGLGLGTSSVNMQPFPTQRRPSNWSFCGRRRKRHRTEFEIINSVSQIDRLSRVLFPLTFLAINIFYWYSYLNSSPRL